MEKNKVKKKRKINGTNIAAIIISTIATLGLICVTIGLLVMANMLKDKPALNTSDFESSESSTIFDKNGEQIAELGLTIRENISFEDLPVSLVDAFVAVEDSRFFEHNGFDVPRFAKAIIANLKTMSFGQGGSTFTMQLCKNTYFVDDSAGKGAAKSVERKVQEIALAMELETKISKKQILELYVNKINFGGDRNIRGVQKAADYYFGKDVSELNLAESALLAGVINAPNAYNPFYHPVAAKNRRDEVLYLMNYHGYISDEEYELAKSIKVEDLLVGQGSHTGNGVSTNYQAYIDVVIDEVYTMTGMDPYTTPMRIYTYMDQNVQQTMDAIQREEYEGISFPDDEFELASIAINNATGEIVGVLGGRNYASGGALLLNHATDQYKQPGSSIKPIMDYVLAFENLGWATSHVMVDKPITYPGTSLLISNSNGQYQGQVTLADALGNSLNTPAIQALQEVIDKMGNKYVIDYLTRMGFNIDAAHFNVQYGIGGGEITVSCKQMAAAQGALINGGSYTTPHTVARIEFLNGKNPVTPSYTSTQTVSPEASYMMAQLLYSNVYGGYANLMQVLKDDYAVYAKTGTTDWGTSGRPYNIPDGSIKDSWVVGSSSEFTVATWIGYERAQKDKPSYITLNTYLGNIQGLTTNAILDATVESYGAPEALVKPDDVVSITHILGTFPYASPLDNMDSQYITTGLIKKDSFKLVDPQNASIEKNTTAAKVTYVENILSINWPKYPDEEALKVAENAMDISLKRSDGTVSLPMTGKRLFDYSWIYGPVRYKADVYVNNELVRTVSSETDSGTYLLDTNPGDIIKIKSYYAYENVDIKSDVIDCDEIKVNDHPITIEIPAQYALDPNGIESYLIGLGISQDNITMISKIGDADSVEVEIKVNGEVLKEKTVLASQLKQCHVTITTTTTNKTKVISLASSVSGSVSKGSTISVSAILTNIEKNVSWSGPLAGYGTFEGILNEKINITIPNDIESGEYSINATADGVQSSITITIE